MTFSDQLFFAKNISTWSERLPAIYHGHFAFVDLDKYSDDKSKKIVHINMIRKPLDR
jgi:heparan sulfate 2-O-sulfotransferase HS2ST1